MGDGEGVEAQSLPEVDPLEDVDWVRVHARALLEARAYVPAQEVDDVVQEGMRRVLEGIAPWDPAGGRSLPAHLVVVGANARRVDVRKAQRRTSGTFEVEVATQLEDAAPPDPEQASAAADAKAKAFRELESTLEGDDDALAVVRCEEREVSQPAEQARLTGLGIDAVRNARKRVKRAVLAFLRETKP